MKKTASITLTAAAFVLLPASQLFAQMTGTSHPEELDDTVPTPAAQTGGSHYVKPSPAVPMPADTAATPAPILRQHDDAVAAPQPYPTETAAARIPQRTIDKSLIVTDDVNSGIVTDVPAVGPNELPIGTRLKATLEQPISTVTTTAGTRFSAILSANVSHNGIVLIPAGSLVNGRITQVRGGRAIGGAAAIRLRPDTVSMPDGATYKLNADVTDLDRFEASHVNNEGAIVANTDPHLTTAAIGLTTTSAVVAGAVIGGGVGAVVGLGVGAGVATVWWFKHDRQQELPRGTAIVFTLTNSLQLNPAPR